MCQRRGLGAVDAYAKMNNMHPHSPNGVREDLIVVVLQRNDNNMITTIFTVQNFVINSLTIIYMNNCQGQHFISIQICNKMYLLLAVYQNYLILLNRSNSNHRTMDAAESKKNESTSHGEKAPLKRKKNT